MKRITTILAPGMILLAAVLTGGWFVQRGIGQEKSAYVQDRLFDEVLARVEAAFVDPVDREELYEAAIEGVLEELGDPNTSFMSAEMVEDFQIRMEGEYGGVGLEVIPRDGWVTVVTPLPGTPGTRMGIRTGDQIVEVEGESVEGWEPDRVVDQLRGPPGTDVSVKIRRPGLDHPIPFTITRELIELRSVPFAITLDEGIGYLPLQSVSETSSGEVRSAVDSLRREGMEKLILDLRANPGGALDQGISITDYFLDPGDVVVETRGRAPNQTEVFSAFDPEPHPRLEVVVLVDERSASASEIIAGAIQDHDRGVVVGAPTFGKGSVQTLYPLTGGNILRLTTARWYTPVGRSIHKDRADQIAAMERSALTLEGFLATLPDTAPKPVFRTLGGRRVLGGGGITPDVLVMADTLTNAEREAILELDRSGGSFVTAVFNFAVQYLQRHPDLGPDFVLSPTDLNSFQTTLEGAGVELSDTAFARAERFIRFQLEREIALQAWGEAGEFRRTLPYDLIAQRALDLLSRAAETDELLELAGDPRMSDWRPNVAEEEDAPVTETAGVAGGEADAPLEDGSGGGPDGGEEGFSGP